MLGKHFHDYPFLDHIFNKTYHWGNHKTGIISMTKWGNAFV